MLLKDFQTHLFSENVRFAYRFEDLSSDMYRNPKNGLFARVNIAYEDIPDLAVIIHCLHLQIDLPPELDAMRQEFENLKMHLAAQAHHAHVAGMGFNQFGTRPD